jgi:hypothetical protein
VSGRVKNKAAAKAWREEQRSKEAHVVSAAIYVYFKPGSTQSDLDAVKSAVESLACVDDVKSDAQFEKENDSAE